MTDRREILRIAALSALALPAATACGSDIKDVLPLPSKPPATPDAQQADEIALVAAYDAAVAGADTDTALIYRRIRDEHAAHLQAMGWEQPLASPTAASKKSAPTRRELMRKERAALKAHTQAAMTAEDGEQSQILALIAASEAQHIVTLGTM